MNSKPVKNIKEAFSYTTTVNGATWDPTKDRDPFKVMTGLGFLDDQLTGISKDEAQKAKAPKVLPFPLDRIIDQLAKVYEELIKTRSTLMVSIKSSLLTKEERNLLRTDMKYVQRCMDLIKKISVDVEKTHM